MPEASGGGGKEGPDNREDSRGELLNVNEFLRGGISGGALPCRIKNSDGESRLRKGAKGRQGGKKTGTRKVNLVRRHGVPLWDRRERGLPPANHVFKGRRLSRVERARVAECQK